METAVSLMQLQAGPLWSSGGSAACGLTRRVLALLCWMPSRQPRSCPATSLPLATTWAATSRKGLLHWLAVTSWRPRRQRVSGQQVMYCLQEQLLLAGNAEYGICPMCMMLYAVLFCLLAAV